MKGEAGRFHQNHSLRVGYLCGRIARHLKEDERALLIAGLLHDVGKSLVAGCTLSATIGWTPKDQEAMELHVLNGFRLLRDRFDFSAHVIVRHHRYQTRAYPHELPEALHPFSEATLVKAERCARLLAVADVFDALHRVNSATGGRTLTTEEIKTKMVDMHRDEEILVKELLDKNVLPTELP